MSSVQSFTATGGEVNIDSTSWYYYTLSPENIYPNNTAHPLKADISFKIRSGQKYLTTSTMYGGCCFGETDVFNQSTSSSSYQSFSTTSTDAAVTESTSATLIRNRIRQTSSSRNAYMTDRSVTLYFYRYDFSTIAGDGIASAMVKNTSSDSSGYDTGVAYDGDTVEFYAEPEDGYVFSHWSDGSTDQRHTVTAGATGVVEELTAYAIASTKTVVTLYNGTQIATETAIPPVAISYNGDQIASVSSGQTATLECDGKIMSGNVTVGSVRLNCSGKCMDGNIQIIIS